MWTADSYNPIDYLIPPLDASWESHRICPNLYSWILLTLPVPNMVLSPGIITSSLNGMTQLQNRNTGINPWHLLFPFHFSLLHPSQGHPCLSPELLGEVLNLPPQLWLFTSKTIFFIATRYLKHTHTYTPLIKACLTLVSDFSCPEDLIWIQHDLSRPSQGSETWLARYRLGTLLSPCSNQRNLFRSSNTPRSFFALAYALCNSWILLFCQLMSIIQDNI